ncbi:hemerythrin domain-containing protein [Asticcacaulis sp. BYS171W]|uniref:Hemerythrin domain-containing protein n=1 Tax=Asticcacaulis aquaticus TaxID=2984212 RepID=A0ABT5HWX7_9CAUL|nr:hemerythrin domain-containing protein [Asticcacaulis aquaticus]MDC7684427.1 hemerythrin domain-containing protein [Asticcacaulis aquaticus]
MEWSSRTLAEIVSENPRTLRYLQENGFDVLNEGFQELGLTAKHNRQDLNAVIEHLKPLLQSDSVPATDWRQKTASEIVAHIVDRFHDTHRSQMADLIALSERVLSVHPDHPQCPHGLTEYLHAMFEDLFMHMMKEENMLFPMLCNGALPMAQGPIRVMQMEHVQHTDALKQLKVLANDFIPPAEACGTWHRLYTELERLYDDLLMHIHIENNVLFVGDYKQTVAAVG